MHCRLFLFLYQMPYRENLMYVFVYIVCVCLGAQCCIELHHYLEALEWCDEGLRLLPTDKNLQELRAKADKQKV